MRKKIARRIVWGLLPALTLFTAQPSLLLAQGGGGGGPVTGTPTPTATPTPTSTPLPTCKDTPPGASCCIAGTGGEMCVVGTVGGMCPEPPLPECSAGSCGGDCNANGMVTVDELVRGVNIGLEVQPVSTCTAMDIDGSGSVTVNELITAVNHALSGCPMAVATLERRNTFAAANRGELLARRACERSGTGQDIALPLPARRTLMTS